MDTVEGIRRTQTALGGRSRRAVDRQIRHSGEGIEVAIVVVELGTRFQTGRGNDAVDAAANGEPVTPRRPIQVGGGFEGLEAARTQDRVSQQAHARPVIGVSVANALEDLAVHDVDQRDRSVVLQELGEVSVERRTPGSEKVDPDRCVGDDAIIRPVYRVDIAGGLCRRSNCSLRL